MEIVVIVIHLMVVLALIATVLLQRSEGGALGIGGGGGGGGFMTGRGAANVLTRSTAILAATFFATSIILTILARSDNRPSDIFRELQTSGETSPANDGTGETVLDQLNRLSGTSEGESATPDEEPATPQTPSEPQVPSSQ